jgi:putative phosphoribosyl transferase
VLNGKTVILVDDGLATGATMKAAAEAARAEGAKKIVVAIPVGARDSLEEMRDRVDEVVCVMEPPHLQAIGQFYRDFSQVEDEEVIRMLTL